MPVLQQAAIATHSTFSPSYSLSLLQQLPPLQGTDAGLKKPTCCITLEQVTTHHIRITPRPARHGANGLQLQPPCHRC
jgi:hypothetical protein